MKSARWESMNKIALISLLLLVLFAWMDSENVIGVKSIGTEQAWNAWWNTQLPAHTIVWYGVLAAIAVIWYILKKDKSEALALFLLPATLIFFGAQDLIYYLISPDVFTESIGCWANVLLPVKLISEFLGETCPTPLSFGLSALIGTGLAIFLYFKLREVQP